MKKQPQQQPEQQREQSAQREQKQRARQRSAQQTQMVQAARAAAILAQGGSPGLMRPQDALALGAHIGNSALAEWIAANDHKAASRVVETEAFFGDGERSPEAVPVAAAPPFLYPGESVFPGENGLSTFPAAELSRQETGQTGAGDGWI